MIRFAVYLLITAFLFAVLTITAQHLLWIDALPSFFYQTLIFLAFTTFVIFSYLFKANKPDFFVQLYLLTMAVKFLAYGVYVFVMIIDDKIGAGPNVVFFLVLYVSFTLLEITFLYRKISGEHKQ